RGARVAIRVPKRGRGRELVELACRNAENVLQTRLLSHDDPETVLTETARCLSLRKLPRRIECFDISNLGGRQAVGARVCFIDAEPRKALYRRYAIRTVAGADDYAMMAEVLKRRFSSDEEPPDLVIIDGGKGHLAAAAAVFADLGIAGPDVVALAKDRHGVGFGAAEGERVYLLGRKEPVSPARYPVVFHMLQRIRDEAHRFAVSYHRRVREKDGLSSRLDTVPGLGKVRRQALLSAFRSVEEIAGASREDLTKVKGIGRKTAALIKEALKDGGRG
ncbi:MAG: helix-hairpin-helix domain-containing protein, partial [Syntrophales bacterium]|nr:helix-hairpin-helix domain-containing protein [Syntrophales bacterium]